MNIIKCPYCSLQGMTKNLGEIVPGGVKIIRSMNGLIDFTIIKADEYQLFCGTCGNVVIYRQPIVVRPQVNILTAWGTIQQYYANGSN
jgi:hypothetical protein